jgi:hypothetical protein
MTETNSIVPPSLVSTRASATGGALSTTGFGAGAGGTLMGEGGDGISEAGLFTAASPKEISGGRGGKLGTEKSAMRSSMLETRAPASGGGSSFGTGKAAMERFAGRRADGSSIERDKVLLKYRTKAERARAIANAATTRAGMPTAAKAGCSERKGSGETESRAIATIGAKGSQKPTREAKAEGFHPGSMAINEASASQRGTKSEAHEKAPMRKAPLEARRRGEDAPKAAQIKAAKPKMEAAARTVPSTAPPRIRFSIG